MTDQLHVSFEIFPPTDDSGEHALWKTVERLASLDPAFVSVTYGAGGTSRKRSTKILDQLVRRTSHEAAAHVTCVGTTREEINALARGWSKKGVKRIIALRGDPPAARGTRFEPHPSGYSDTVALIRGLLRVAEFEIAVGAYPETHPDATSPEADLDHLKRKLDEGAAFGITQYFFDAETYLRFRDRAVAAGIDKPIVPGILPVTNFARVAEFSARCGATVPYWMRELFEGLDDDAETRRLVAASTACELCNRLKTEGVTRFHIYTLNRAELSMAICRRLGMRPRLADAA
ncbi:MAG: methylenetetrahydrofolate reductase [NAD(P)H] [Rhodospirillaceae bacterium]|nr:methylenetetrahydrofolate reductase [NAD(P)H] [Rhodospirillaceae bacterium]